MGFSVQSNMLVAWLAATTYFTTAAGVLALVFSFGGGETSTAAYISSGVISGIVALIPFPACAIAGYHVILFGIGMVHSKSIALLEDELMDGAIGAVKTNYCNNLLGSKAETKLTDFGTAGWSMKVSSAVAYVVPLVGAATLVVLSLNYLRIQHSLLSWWFIVAFAVYTAVLIGLIHLAVGIAFSSRRRMTSK